MMKQLPDVSSKYGAPMGRADKHVTIDKPQFDGLVYKPIAPKFSLRRIRLNGGGYDSGGAYWGIGTPLYWADDGEGTERFLRARTRELAKTTIREEFPEAKFWK
jgi:hypothetical protein